MNTTINRHGGAITASIIIGVVLIVCAVILSSTIVKVRAYGNTIAVTGAAFKPIKSDFAIWEGQVSVTTATIEEGYAKLKRDVEHLKTFLRKNGFDEDAYELKGVQINKQYDRDRKQTGVMLSQQVSLELDDVDRVSKLSRDASTLLEKGVEFMSYQPRYLFTKLDDVKIEMIRAATENAKLRVEQIAESTGKSVGAPTSARVGVFQIRPLHSQEVSSYGISDVSSIDKEIVCTVHISFLIE